MALAPRQQQAGVVVLLALFVVILLKQMSSLGFLGTKPTPPPSSAPSVPSQPTIPEVIQRVKDREEALPQAIVRSDQPVVPTVKYTAESTRDPFQSLLLRELRKQAPAETPGGGNPKQAVLPKPPDLNVQGVIWGGPRPQALIDDGVYEIGDVVKNAKILSISREGVSVEVQGLTFEVRISTSSSANVPGRPGYRPPLLRQAPLRNPPEMGMRR